MLYILPVMLYMLMLYMLPVMLYMLHVMLYAACDALYLCEHMPLPVMRFRKLSICHFFVIFVRI